MYIPEIVIGLIIGFILGVMSIVGLALCMKNKTKKEDK